MSDQNHDLQRADEQAARDTMNYFAGVPLGRVVWPDVFKMLGDAPPVLLESWAKAKGYSARAFYDALKTWRCEVEMGRPITSCGDLVEAVAARAGITISYQSMIDRPTTGRIQATYTVADLTNDVIAQAAALGLGYRDSLIRAEVERWKQRNRQATLDRIERDIFDPKADRCQSLWDAVGRALVMPGCASPDYAVAVLQTTIWQTKRKLLGMPITDHLMVVLTGVQGNGKTTFLKRFLSPIAELVSETNFREAMDTRNLDIWNNFVLFFDEMEKADSASIESIKNAITGTHKSARLLHTNGNATVANRSTLVGAMNGTVGTVLRDPTGMRRYAPVPTGNKPGQGKRGEVDWATLGSLDYRALWRSVQVDDERPANRVKAELLLLQDVETAVDPIAYFLRDHFETYGGSVGATDLHRDYSEMMRDHFPSHHRLNIQSFGMRIANFEGEDWYPFVRKERGRKGSVYVVKGEQRGRLAVLDKVRGDLHRGRDSNELRTAGR